MVKIGTSQFSPRTKAVKSEAEEAYLYYYFRFQRKDQSLRSETILSEVWYNICFQFIIVFRYFRKLMRKSKIYLSR